MVVRPRALAVGLGSALLAGALGVVAIGGGDFPMTPAQVVAALTGGGTPAERFIVTELRLPRVVTALLVGAALALAGALFQSLTRNPLGSPDLLGVSQGAAAGALLVVVAGGGTALAPEIVAGLYRSRCSASCGVWPGRRSRTRRPKDSGRRRRDRGGMTTRTAFVPSGANAAPSVPPIGQTVDSRQLR